MKKRTVKDFIALYAPEDEEMLVLIQSGISADKTFLDTFWAAHIQTLAMADVQTGQVISGRCCLSWPLTDEERERGDYSKRFTKGQIYRVKARAWKGDAFSEPQWYVTKVLEGGVSCPALEEIWTEYTKPILPEDEVLGTLTLDREMSTFDGTCKWVGEEVRISLDVEIEKRASWTRVTNVMKKLVADQEDWDKSLRAMAAQKLTALPVRRGTAIRAVVSTKPCGIDNVFWDVYEINLSSIPVITYDHSPLFGRGQSINCPRPFSLLNVQGANPILDMGSLRLLFKRHRQSICC